jgi:hypothetical protein
MLALRFRIQQEIVFDKYYFLPREDSRATQRVKARDGGLHLGRWRIRAVTVTGVFDLLKKPVYTACRVWLLRHPFRSVVSV